MVGVVVNHDLIATPVPTLYDRVIVRRDVPIKIAKPEPLPVSSRHHEYMLRAKAGREASVRPGLVHAGVRIVAAAQTRPCSVRAPMADPCGIPDRYRRYCVRSIHRCRDERADNRYDIAGPP